MSRIPIPGTEDDVVFSDSNYDVYKEIGGLIYRASKDAALFQQLHDHPRDALLNAGVPAGAIQGLGFNVVQDKPDLLNIVVPEVKDEADFPTGKGFDRYLVELAVVTIRACKR